MKKVNASGKKKFNQIKKRQRNIPKNTIELWNSLINALSQF